MAGLLETTSAFASDRVCYYPTFTGLAPLDLLHAAAQEQCHPAPLAALPKGDWHVYRVTAEGVSDRVHAPGALENDLPVVPAASLTLEVGTDDQVFVYVPNTGALFKAAVENTSIRVPALRRLAIFRTSDAKVSGVAVIDPLKEGAQATVRFKDRDVIIVSLDPRVFKREDDEPPTLRVELHGRPVAASLPLTTTPETAAIAVFEAPSSVEAKVSAEGRAWQPATVIVAPGNGVRSAAVEVRPLLPLVVQWHLSDSTRAALSRLHQFCQTDATHEEPARIDLLSCPGVSAAANLGDTPLAGCAPIASREITPDAGSGVVDFAPPEPATYVARFSYNGRPLYHEAIVTTGKRQYTPFDVRPETYLGRITFNGKPMRAQVLFARNPPVTSADDGHFAAVLGRTPGALPITVQSCDDTLYYVDIPTEAGTPEPNVPYDIDIPDKPLTVSVIDAATSRPIPGAKVMLTVVDDASATRVLAGTLAGTTDEHGKLVRRGGATQGYLQAQAMADGYAANKSQPVPVDGSLPGTLTVALQKKAYRGRIIGPSPGGGRIYWYRADGTRLEDAVVGPDAAFVYARERQPDDIAWYVGDGTPLTRLHTLESAEDELRLGAVAAPLAPEFTVTLSVAAADTYFFTLITAGVTVPWEVLSEHLIRHGGCQPLLNPGGSVRITRIALAPPMEVRAAPHRMFATARDPIAFERGLAQGLRIPVNNINIRIEP